MTGEPGRPAAPRLNKAGIARMITVVLTLVLTAAISSGPYRIVRHPFYISLIVSQLIYPLAVGSPYALIPALLIALLFVWRTAREDETLRLELEGYEAFTKRTRYRLVPGLW
jgi:protein-S-isoprenylcysteine O-methyltransferase Ste14